MKSILTISLLLIGSLVLAQVKATDTIEKTLSFEKASSQNVLYIANINGDVIAKRGSGNQIKITARRTLNAKTDGRLEEAKEINLGVKDRYDTLIVFVKGACGSFGQRNHKWNKQSELGGWGYDWNECHDKYDFEMDITVEVPANQNLILSTINKGDVEVAGLNGSLQIRNINGDIDVKDASGFLKARTINGDLNVTYTEAPNESFSLYTLNGDIKAEYPSKLNADVSFKSYNGDFYTNEEITQLPMRISKEETRNTQGVKYKLGGQSVIRFNNGGFKAEVETFNGDAYLTNLALKSK